MSEFVSIDAEEHYYVQESPRKLDFIFNLCKFQSQGLPINLPGWRGFNTPLANDIPMVSKISYLPIIDNPITKMTTINDFVRQSVQIADELELPQVMIVVAVETVNARI